MLNSIKSLSAMIVVFLAFSMKATPIYVNPLGENDSSVALSVQGIVDARRNTIININNDQLDAGIASSWNSSGSMSLSIIAAVAGSANLNKFGIYNSVDPSQKVQIFLGGQGGDAASFSSPWTKFGFYLINGNYGNTWYSNPALNGGQAHMVSYLGQGETLNLGIDPNNPVGSSLLSSSDYLMCWEDLELDASDYDYNDMIVILKGGRPAPELGGTQSVPDESGTIDLLVIAMVGLLILQKPRVIYRM
jgi:hypothetical protein